VNQLVALLAGAALSASDHPLHLWWLQFVVLVPFWWALARQRSAGHSVWTIGFSFGAAYSAAVVASAGLALPIVAAGAVSTLQWTIGGLLAGRVLLRGAVAGPLAAAATLTLLELLVWNVFPLFGTAQAFVRPLSAAPMLVAFVAFTGVAGLVFVVAALQALVLSALRGPARTAPLVAAGAIVAVAAALDVARWTRPLGATTRVAVFGWGESMPLNSGGKPFVHRAAADAANEKCALLVTPETGMQVQSRDNATKVFGGLATTHRLHLALGLWHTPTSDNRIWFVAPDGALLGEYRKSHLVPWLEDYTTGDGVPVVVPFGGSRLGGMICQDDNFTDVARAHGRDGVPLLAVPTNDWPEIREFHLENAIFRCIENGYAIARAASGGISAIVSSRGEVIARDDHVTGRLDARPDANVRTVTMPDDRPGVRLLCADVATGDGAATMYARFGDVPMLALGAVFVLASLRRRRGTSPAPAP